MDESKLTKILSCFYAKVNKRITDCLFHIDQRFSKLEQRINEIADEDK